MESHIYYVKQSRLQDSSHWILYVTTLAMCFKWWSMENFWNNKRFFRNFYNATLFFFFEIYYPTSSQALNYFYEISIAFAKYRELLIFDYMCIEMKTKIKNYWKEVPLIFIFFCFGVILDLQFKLVDLQFLLDATNNNIQIEDTIDIYRIKRSLELFFNEYYENMQNKLGEASSLSSKPNVSKEGIWDLMNHNSIDLTNKVWQN